MNKKTKKILEKIAKDKLGFTLVRQNWDRKDFHDVAVWSIEEALLEAYEKGLELGYEAGAGAGMKAGK